MRYILAALTFFAALYLNVSAQAERRIFILPNNADGYGIDHCLATGARSRTMDDDRRYEQRSEQVQHESFAAAVTGAAAQ